MKTIEMPDFEKKMVEKSLALIDVRPAERYVQGHVPGAVNLPFSELENHLETLETGKDYYVICQLGLKSQEAVALLEEKGFSAVNVQGGTAAFSGDLVQD